jgi:SOS-response transcriptional repressor LexA
MSDHTADQERERLLDEIAAGRHDDALIRLVAAAIAAEGGGASPAWDDARFLAWWCSRARVRAARDAALLSDEEHLAAGRAFQARVVARQHGIQWHAEHPALVAPPVAGPPASVLDAAAARGSAPLVDLAVAAGVGRELWDEPAEAWLALAPSLGVAPPAGRYLALRVAGDSMEPVMHTGDTVLVALGRPLRTGAVVVARRPEEGYVCKRVGRLRARVAELESLAPGREVIRIPRDARLVVGQVVAAWCHHCGSA